MSYGYRNTFQRSASNTYSGVSREPGPRASGSAMDAARLLTAARGAAGISSSNPSSPVRGGAAPPAKLEVVVEASDNGDAGAETTTPTSSPKKNLPTAAASPPTGKAPASPVRVGARGALAPTSVNTGGAAAATTRHNSPYRSLVPVTYDSIGNGVGGGLKACASADDVTMRRAFHGDTLIGPPHLPTPPPSSPNVADAPASPYKPPQVFTIVFDLDETLVCNRFPGKAVIRPHATAMLQSLASMSNQKLVVELVLWTASVESVAREVLVRLDPRGDIFKHHIFRDKRWFKETGYTKDLRRLGRDMTRTVIVENSPHSVVLNRQQSLLVRDFLGHAPNDTDLAAVREILEDWIKSAEDESTFVPIADYLKAHPKVSPANQVIATPAPRGETTAVAGRGVGVAGRGRGVTSFASTTYGRSFGRR